MTMNAKLAGRRYKSLDAFYGPANAPVRAVVMSAIHGRKIAKSAPEAGWHRFRNALVGLYKIPSNCAAVEDDLVIEAITARAAVPTG